ncbi:MAG TPA: DUF2284 domain-containing protein [Candidatus Methanofastidiosa archaeon]|nr:DUF2284 domain-containing protein [Candidatus Methanofastidiosa archaeon]HPR41027.1 DUF2284 domain-containing protein [Candidatus Methanofastidiosa archaeon]
MIQDIIAKTLSYGVNDYRVIDPGNIKVYQWVRIKCQFGCPVYDTNYTCPPHVPELDKVREFFSEYKRGILIELSGLRVLDDQRKVQKILLKVEREAFLRGYYKAFGISAGPCHICKACKAIDGRPCHDTGRRPSLEALGVDVYELITSSGMDLSPVQKKSEEYKSFGLLLLD